VDVDEVLLDEVDAVADVLQLETYEFGLKK
jgi:hypothetical protein